MPSPRNPKHGSIALTNLTISSLSCVAAEEEQIIRGFFMKKVNDTFSKNYRSLVPFNDQELNSSNNRYSSLESRLQFCLDNHLIPFLRLKNADTNEVLITIDITKEFKDVKINFVQNFADLARMLGAEIKPTKVNGKTSRPIRTSVAKLTDFMSNEESPE
jgi:hypothetical protein